MCIEIFFKCLEESNKTFYSCQRVGFKSILDIIKSSIQSINFSLKLISERLCHFNSCKIKSAKRLKSLYPDAQILPLDYDPDVSFANIENRLQMLIMNAKAC
jgi:hypothetical protein